MRVLLIDPWGINNTSEYLNGLIYGLSDLVELTVFTNFYFEQYVKTKASAKKVFFKISEKMSKGNLRKAVRGIEYISSYNNIISHLKKNKYDIVHINWLVNYKTDIVFLRKIKKYCPKLVYTAHNVIPHINGEKSIPDLRNIYSIADRIIVHGEAIKREFYKYFPEYQNKLYVQKHGCILRSAMNEDTEYLPKNIKNKINKYRKVFLTVGAIFPNKGVDRAADIWIKNFTKEDALFIIGGRRTAGYPEFESIMDSICMTDNMILLDGFIENNIMNALLAAASAIILPYRHASMSGVIFTAAQYSKPIICTDVGALTEYLEPGVDSVVCENSNAGIKNAIVQALQMKDCELVQMGKVLHDNIFKKCDWQIICTGIVNNVYKN